MPKHIFVWRNIVIVALALLMSACGSFMKPLDPSIEAAPAIPISMPATQLEAQAPPMPEAIVSMPAPIVTEPQVAPRVATAPAARAQAPARAKHNPGRYFQSDGPGEINPRALMDVPEPQPKHEPLAAAANRPYTVFGQRYTPAQARKAQRQRGVASWYGRQFHGRKTSTGERYNMYALSAAHPTLPLPSYVRVTNLANKRSIVVRVNDRGPFTNGRLIDLSYAAAAKLGFVERGSTSVELETIVPPAPMLLAAAP